MTRLDIQKELFLINGKQTYSEIPGSNPDVHGLLMNARFIQGIFDDKNDVTRFARFGNPDYDPAANTANLVAALPQWYEHGLRAFTLGLQGGGACFTINNRSIDNNPFGEDGLHFDPAYATRLDTLIRGADAVGMIVIVSFFYGEQALRLKDGRAVRNAVTTASRFLKEGGYTNVIIEVANELNIGAFLESHPLICNPDGMATLLDLARAESGGLPVGCSGRGGYANREVAEASDVILIHGNGTTRQRFYNLIRTVKSWELDRPIVTNEDSQAIGQLEVAFKTRTSWGYYNNMTKQEPPADWSITRGEDTFFARRMAEGLGISLPPIPKEEHYYLQGFEPEMEYDSLRWLRLASMYPETIDYVDFCRNGELFYTSYDEPFSINFESNWRQGGVVTNPGDLWKAEVHLRSGDAVSCG